MFQFGDFYGEQLGIDFDRMMPARAPAYISKDDNGELTTEKRNIFIVRLRNAILDLTPGIDLSDLNINYVKDGDNIKGLNAAVSAVLNSVPESFVCENKGMKYSIVNGKFDTFSLGLKPNAAQMRKDYDNERQAVKEALFPIGTGGMSKTEIALAIHDYIALHTRYDYAAVESGSKDNPNMYNAYGVLVNGLAVCQGYALAYMDLLSANSVKSYFVSSKNINHAWLIIETEKGWYHSDVTWDDPRLEAGDYTNDGDYMGYCQHDYFMNTVADINASHFKNASNDANPSVLFDTTPAAAATAHENSGFWSGIRCGMAYIGGKWYYNDSKLWKQNVNGTEVRHTKGKICLTPYGTERQANNVIAENATAFAVVDGSLVYARFSEEFVTDAIMCYDTATGAARMFADVAGDTMVTEIAAGRLNLNNGLYDRGTVVYTDANSNLYTIKPNQSLDLGDVNTDGRLTIADVTLICRHIMGQAQLSGAALAAADINSDGSVGVADAVLLCQMISEGNE